MSERAIYTPRPGESRYIRRAVLMRDVAFPPNPANHYVIRLGVRSGRDVAWLYTFSGLRGGIEAGNPYPLTGYADVAVAVEEGSSVVVEVAAVGSPPTLRGTALHLIMGCDLAAVVRRGGWEDAAVGFDSLVGALSESGGLDHHLVVDLEEDDADAVAEQVYPSTLDNDGSTVDVASTASETTLYTFDLPANTLIDGRAVKLWLHGDALANTGANTVTVRVKLGGTTIYQDVTGAWVNSATRRPWVMEFIVGASDSSSAQTLGGSIHIGPVGTATTGLGDLAGATVSISDTPVLNTASKDGTTVLALAVTVQWSASSASLSFRKYQASLVWL
jgi:hypothetical protein